MGKTYKNKSSSKMSGRSSEKSGRTDDPDLALDMLMQKKQKSANRKGMKRNQSGRSE